MRAYLIANIEITDPKQYADYIARIGEVTESFGGRYLVRGGTAHKMEGHWHPHRMIVVEFPDMATAQRFYESPEYAPLLALRHSASETDMVLVEGLAAHH